MRSPRSLHVQEPTVIPSTMINLTSFIICHCFTSPSWCTHLAQHVSVGDNTEMAQWYQDVMFLVAGQCVVFSPSALMMMSNDSSVWLLSRGYLELNVRLHLSLDGGASLLAIRRTLPSIDWEALIVNTPLTPAGNYLPAQWELSYTAGKGPLPTRELSISVLRDKANAHVIPSIG